LLYPALVAASLSLFALIPLLQQHFFASSDGLYHVYRAIEVGRCLEDGGWICRWAPDQFLGYGTPLFNFYSPFIYYVTNLFHTFGLGWVNATRAMMAVFLVFSAVSAFAYAAEFLSKPAAVVAAVAYVYVPYHLVNAFYRGDLPEFAAMAWFPAILWAFSRVARPSQTRRQWLYLPLAALAYGGLIVTHNLSAFIYTGVLFLYCLWLLLVNRLEGSYGRGGASLAPTVLAGSRLLGATLLGFGLSAFLSIPALSEKELVTLEGLLYVSHADHFPTLQQMMPNSIVHAYGIIFPDSPVYAYKLGLVQVALGGLGALLALALWKRFSWRARGEAVVSLFLFALAFYFTQPPSLWLWNSVPLLPHAQFPWRFLLLMALPTSLMVGYLVDAGGRNWRRWATPPLVAFVLLTNLLGLKPIMANAEDGEIDLASSVEFELLYHLMGTTVAGEYIPRTARERPFVTPTALAWALGGEAPPVHPTASDPNLKVDLLERDATSASYRVNAGQPGRAVFNLVYFPEWRARLDGRPLDTAPSDPHGLVSVQIPPGSHTVELTFADTPIRVWSERLSAACLLVTLGMLAFAFLPLPLGEGRREAPARRQIITLALPQRKTGLRRTALAVLPFALTLVGLPFGAKLFADSYRPSAEAQQPIKIDLGSTIQLVGYDLGTDGRLLGWREAATAGSHLDLGIYWQPMGATQADEQAAASRVYARLSNIDEQQWSQAIEESREALPDGRTFRSLVRLPVPPAQPPGVYQIDVGAQARDGKPYPVKNMELVELLPTQGSVRLGPLRVRSNDADAPSLRLPAGSSFDNAVRLESYDVGKGVGDRRLFSEAAAVDLPGGPLRAAAGETLQLDFVWRALRARPGQYVISASLVDERGFKWAVRDAEPADGMYPTWMWSPGEQVRDQLRMPVPPETPPGRYRLALRVLQDGKPLSVVGPDGSPSGAQADLVEMELARSEVGVRERELKGVTSRQKVRLNEDLEIAAADYGRTELRPGENSDVSLVWHALRDVKRDYSVRLSVVGPSGAVVAQTAPARLAGDFHPSDRWEARDYFRGQFRLTASASARPGSARLALELLDTSSGRVVASNNRLADVKLLERIGGQASATAKHPLDLTFGPAIRLLGYDLKPDASGEGGSVKSGDTLAVTLLWQAEGEPGQPYTVFTQLLNSDGRLVAQHDSPPANGRSPTNGWLKDDRVADEHLIELPKELPTGEYRLIAGLYDQRNERLTLPDGQNFAQLTTIRVR
jgi:hypothetical protein